MGRINRMPLRWRLWTGFFICTAITAVGVGVGVWSLRRLASGMEETTERIAGTIEHQNKHSSTLAEIRATINRVGASTTESELLAARETMPCADTKDASECPQARLECETLGLVEELIRERSDLIDARAMRSKTQGELERLAEARVKAQERMNRAAAEIVDDAEFEAVMASEDAVAAIKENVAEGKESLTASLDTMSTATEEAVARIKAALKARAALQEMNAAIKEASHAKDVAIATYAKKELDTLARTMGGEVDALPEGDERNSLRGGLEELVGLGDKMIDARIASLKDEEASATRSFADLAAGDQWFGGDAAAENEAPEATATNEAPDPSDELSKRVDALIAEMAEKTLEVVDATEFDATIAIEDAMSEVSDGVGERNEQLSARVQAMSEAMQGALDTVKNALRFQSAGRAIENLGADMLLSKEPEKVKLASRELDAMADGARARLSNLPDNDAKKAAAEALDALHTGVAAMLEGRVRMLQAEDGMRRAEGRLARLMAAVHEGDDPPTLPERLSALDVAMLEGVGEMKTNADRFMSEAQGRIAARENMLYGVGLIAALGALVVGYFVLRSIVRPLKQMEAAAGEFAKGNFECAIHYACDDEIGHVVEGFRRVAAAQNERAEVVRAIAGGDLTMTIQVDSDRDALGLALQRMVENLGSLIADVADAANHVGEISSEVSTASDSLAQGAMTAASSIAGIGQSIDEIGRQTTHNADNAQQANSLTSGARDAATIGNERMGDMVRAMDEINEASREIGRIIRTIDDIAFQTNLLALNAAVEAARAGQHGKGFAVVAEEVRSLAGRSADAARETTSLIESSNRKVANGAEIANQTAEALNEIVDSIAKASEFVGEIAAASTEQAEGIGKVGAGLNEIDDVTQRSAAGAEQTLAVSAKLGSEAAGLQGLIGQFRLRAAPVQKSETTPEAKRAADSIPNKSTWGEASCDEPVPTIAMSDDEFGRF